MSRSAYIWTVVTSDELLPLAAFTVRYECAHWLSRYPDADDVKVYRLQDGHHHPQARPVWLDPETLDPGGAGPMDPRPNQERNGS